MIYLSVVLDLQLETVEIAMALIVALLRSCVSFYGTDLSAPRYGVPYRFSSRSATGCNTKGYRALLTAKVPENILILLSW